jgi:hypothetical protein
MQCAVVEETGTACAAPQSARGDPRCTLDLARLDAAKRLGVVAAADVEKLLGHAFDSVVEGWLPELSGEVRGATLAMSLARERAEIRLAIVVDAGSLPALAELVLGSRSPDPAMVDDMLLEMANTAAGAFKAIILEQGHAFTLGLPLLETSFVEPTGASTRWVATFANTGVHVGILGELRSRENQLISSAMLEEGMVVARDLLHDDGFVLVAAGTRLTLTGAARIAHLFGEQFMVEVAVPA